MSKKKVVVIITAFFLAYLLATDFKILQSEPKLPLPPEEGNLPFLSVSDGFKIDIFAEGLNGPRVIVFDSKGALLVSETKNGRVVLVEDTDGNGKSDSKKIILDGLNSPHGLDFYKDPRTGVTYLYIAESNQVTRYVYDINKLEITNKNSGQNIASLPDGGRHFTRTIAFGPNFRGKPILEGAREKETLSSTKLYISVGSSCDVCVEQSWKRAAILESDPSGSFTAEFAGGLRNSVFFTFHPKTKEIWATEMGRDNLGDDLPPDEINIVKVAGPENKFGARRYGWPFCFGDQVKDTKFEYDAIGRADLSDDCSTTEKPVIKIPAHSAPLGLAFVTADNWPNRFKHNLLVAYHGSWNRSAPTGYKVVRFRVDQSGNVSETSDFITGWLNGKNVLGRPVDLKFGPDGALYLTDDFTGRIYRVTSPSN